MRAMMSAPPPGANGTTIRTGWLGHVSAALRPGASVAATATNDAAPPTKVRRVVPPGDASPSSMAE